MRKDIVLRTSGVAFLLIVGALGVAHAQNMIKIDYRKLV